MYQRLFIPLGDLMKRSLRLPMVFTGIFLSAILLLFFLTSPRRFQNFCDDFFKEELTANALTLHYVVKEPENYGLKDHDISLGSYDLDGNSAKRALLKKYVTLHTIFRASLSEKNQRTYDSLKYVLKLELDRLKFSLLEEPLVPSIGIQSQLPILLAEYTLDNEADLQDYLALLSCIPAYFDSLLAFEAEKIEAGTFLDPESATELLTYCQEFTAEKEHHFLAETFEERLETLPLSASQKGDYTEKHRQILTTEVFPAYEKLAVFLETHQNDGTNENGLYYFPYGTDYYAWLLRSEVGTDHSFEEIESMLDEALREDAAVIASLTNKDPTLLAQRDDISIDTSNPKALTIYLSKRAANDFPGIPEVSSEIRDIPKSMEPHLSPAFYLVPPIDDCDHNVVYLNNGYLTSSLSFFTTLAHESYPGHLYQTVFENGTDPHPVQRLLSFGGYTEGWATYAEQLSYHYAPISSDLAALLSTTRAMTLNLYAHLDLFVHAYGWTEEECVTYLKKFGITGKASAHQIFCLVKQQPANYLKYYLGYLEICRLKERAENTLGSRFDQKEFHRFLLTYGPAPFSLLEKYMEEWLHSSKD